MIAKEIREKIKKSSWTKKTNTILLFMLSCFVSIYFVFPPASATGGGLFILVVFLVCMLALVMFTIAAVIGFTIRFILMPNEIEKHPEQGFKNIFAYKFGAFPNTLTENDFFELLIYFMRTTAQYDIVISQIKGSSKLIDVEKNDLIFSARNKWSKEIND